KFLARENQTGKMGTFETSFVIPDLTVRTGALAISSVVLSNQREPLSAAVGSATNKKKLLDIHPLVLDGQKLVPSVTRVFRKDQNMFVYFELYDPATDHARKTPCVESTQSAMRPLTDSSNRSHNNPKPNRPRNHLCTLDIIK